MFKYSSSKSNTRTICEKIRTKKTMLKKIFFFVKPLCPSACNFGKSLSMSTSLPDDEINASVWMSSSLFSGCDSFTSVKIWSSAPLIRYGWLNEKNPIKKSQKTCRRILPDNWAPDSWEPKSGQLGVFMGFGISRIRGKSRFRLIPNTQEIWIRYFSGIPFGSRKILCGVLRVPC